LPAAGPGYISISFRILQKTHLTLLPWTIGKQVSPAEAYQLCRYEWMREALTALLERLSVLEPVAAATAAATPPELTDQQAGMYMMLQASSDGAVALC